MLWRGGGLLVPGGHQREADGADEYGNIHGHLPYCLAALLGTDGCDQSDEYSELDENEKPEGSCVGTPLESLARGRPPGTSESTIAVAASIFWGTSRQDCLRLFFRESAPRL